MRYVIAGGSGVRTLIPLLVGGLALALVGCAGNNATASKPSAAANGKQAGTGQPDANTAARAEDLPLAGTLVPGIQPEQAVVTIKAIDQHGKVIELTFDSIFFDYDKYEIKPEFAPAIKHNAQMLEESPNLHIIIEGHCDERGTTEYNLALGQRRALAVFDALAEEAVAKQRMKTISYGKEKPIDMAHDEHAWAKNRRSQFRTT